jgi:hypothetical protein
MPKVLQVKSAWSRQRTTIQKGTRWRTIERQLTKLASPLQHWLRGNGRFATPMKWAEEMSGEVKAVFFLAIWQ